MLGKRTSFLSLPAQLRADPRLSDAVHIIAASNYRSANEQILCWIAEGIKREEARNRGEMLAPGPKPVSTVKRKQGSA